VKQAKLAERVRDCSPDDLDRLPAHPESQAVGKARGRPHDHIVLLVLRRGGSARRPDD